jgi:hypothetical protein
MVIGGNKRKRPKSRNRKGMDIQRFPAAELMQQKVKGKCLKRLENS